MNLHLGNLSRLVAGAAIEVHKELGPGLLESAYQQALALELAGRKIPFRRELPLNVSYKGQELGLGYRIDFLIADRLIVELKSVEAILPIHQAQLLTYMRIAGVRVGYLLNFNVHLLKHGITRRVL